MAVKRWREQRSLQGDIFYDQTGMCMFLLASVLLISLEVILPGIFTTL
jgi:hypothetical protein